MSLKNALLVALAVLVVGMGVYLFVQVRATPVEANAVPVKRDSTATASATEDKPDPGTGGTAPEAPPVPGSTRTLWEREPKGEGKANTLIGSRETVNDDRQVDLKLDNLMEIANKAYDAQDFDQAVAIAGKVLAKEPDNVRMLRIMVSANCIQGDSAVAQQHYEKLPQFDREQMKTRCDRYGVTFKDP